MIRVMIADDQQLIRQSLRIVLEKESDQIRVCGVAGNGREVIETLDQTKPDVILMDIRMPVLDGVQCTKKVKETHPEIRIIILTTFDLSSDLDRRIVARQLRYSILRYMQSPDFQPTLNLSPDVLRHLFEREAPAVDMFTRESPDELKPKFSNQN